MAKTAFEEVDLMGIRIGGASDMVGQPLPAQPEAGTGVAGSGESQFQLELRKVEREEAKGRLRELMSKIETQGRELSKSLTFENLEKYKLLVRNFIKEAVANTYDMGAGDRDTWSRKKFTVVERIDRELEALTSEVMGKESDTLRVVGRLVSIKGLLVDLIA